MSAKVRSQLYLSARQLPDAVMDLASTNSDWVVRTSADPYAVVPALKQSVNRVSGNMVMFGEQSMRDVISNSLSARKNSVRASARNPARHLRAFRYGVNGWRVYAV